MRKYGVDNTYFIPLQEIVIWIEKFRDSTNGHLPTIESLVAKFPNFRELGELEPIGYVVNVLKQNRAYIDYRAMLSENVSMANNGQAIEAMLDMRSNLDNLLKKFTGTLSSYDWVRNALERYDRYMEKHGHDGLAGLSTGITQLDEITGGWRDDDLILLAGRTNEGKSLVGSYFAYHVWRKLAGAGMTDPVLFLTTEMSELEVAYRLDTMKAHFSNRALNEGRLPDHELYREYLESLHGYKNGFIIMTQEMNRGKPFTPTDIKAIIESERPAFVVIDQLYDLHDGTGETDIRRRIVNVSTQIRDINLNTKTPTLLVAQAGRSSAVNAKKDPNSSPDLHEIQESDNPAQKATRVITMRLINDIFKLSVKKNRGGPRNQDIYLRADIDTGIWEEISAEEQVF